MMFFFPITKKSRARYATARQLLDAAITQSRQPIFYTDLAVPDTFDGRFEMISLHVGLIVSELAAQTSESQKMAQALFDETFLNLEKTCREIGVGDLSVPRHIKRMMSALKGRALTYIEAEAAGALPEALARNLYGTVERPDQSVLETMASYMKAFRSSLQVQPLMTGVVQFPLVDTSGVKPHGAARKAA
jgi:cytochrome b pre-mRNA-processing protein 3